MRAELLRALVDAGRRWIPRGARLAVQRLVPLTDLKRRYFAAKNPLAAVEASDEDRWDRSCRAGIVHNQAQDHRHYVAACLELGIPFRVLDLARPDWLDLVRSSGCDLLLVWPDAVLSGWAAMIKDRVEILHRSLGISVVPSCEEIWLYEDKRRQSEWLKANDVPHPRTQIYFRQEEAMAFAERCELPIVFKTSFGASATGVRILRSRRDLLRLVRRVFSRGFVADGMDRRDRQWGCVLLQEFLPDVEEWRMVRIGDSYFGHKKGRVGDFHSGSGAVDWEAPDPRHLDFLHEVTEKGRFRSMDVDLFETREGRLLVNELQTVFGADFSVDQTRIDGRAGRFVRLTDPPGWRFEDGAFAKNACANARLLDALQGRDREKAVP